MALPAPNLDDRRFQQLVDDAKRMVQQRCPEWTDHNVSDPGVTLIETFAFMVDQLLYRLNRVPERIYVKFLELLGHPALPAHRRPRRRHLLAVRRPSPEAVASPAGTEVATSPGRSRTRRSPSPPPSRPRRSCPALCGRAAAAEVPGTLTDRTRRWRSEKASTASTPAPKPGDALLRRAVRRRCRAARWPCASTARSRAWASTPTHPPLVWEAWDGRRVEPCEVEPRRHRRPQPARRRRRSTCPPTTPSLVRRTAAAPAGCAAGSVEAGARAAVLQRLAPDHAGWPPSPSAAPPRPCNADLVRDEILGISEGVPGQRFALQHAPGRRRRTSPAVASRCSTERAGSEWTVVEDFAASRGPTTATSSSTPAPARSPSGPPSGSPTAGCATTGRCPPRAPPSGSALYRTGGGRQGNVARGAVSVLQVSIPYVAAVENRRPAAGGVDGETHRGRQGAGPDPAADPGPGRHRRRTTSSWPGRRRPRWRGSAASRPGRRRAEWAGHRARRPRTWKTAATVPSTWPTWRRRPKLESGRYLDVRRTIAARVVVEPPGTWASRWSPRCAAATATTPPP